MPVYYPILLILGVILILLCVRFIFKSFLSQYKMGHKGVKALLVIFLILIMLASSSISIGTISLQEAAQWAQPLPDKSKELLVIISLTAGYCSYVSALIIAKGVKVPASSDISY